MNAADSMVDVDYLRQRADAYELEALRLEDSTTQQHRVPGLYEKARKLRAEALQLEQHIRGVQNFFGNRSLLA
jgi:hypothetical protein